MASVATKKHFATATALRHFSPAVLSEFLHCFLPYLTKKNLHSTDTAKADVLKSQKNFVHPPADATAENMPYDSIRTACMAGDVEPILNRVLFFASHLGTENGWKLIEEEMADRETTPAFNPKEFTLYDLPILTWLRRNLPDDEHILEESYARGRMHAKSAYTYYAPLRPPPEQFQPPTPEALEELRSDLALHFTGDENNADVKFLRYDFDDEVWFLVRYPGHTVRPDAIKDGADDDKPFTPAEYDAVVYHKTYGDLRMNTTRKKEHERYRIVFGHALLGTSNVFDPKKQIITTDPLTAECVHFFDLKDSGDFPRVRPTEISFYDKKIPGRRITWRAQGNKNAHLFDHPLETNPNRLLPESADKIVYAKFSYRLSPDDGWQSVTVHKGMDLRFERDGDSSKLETWLRDRGFILDVFPKTKQPAAA